ncbi:cell division protein PerM [Blastococcus sp. SYSU D00820]
MVSLLARLTLPGQRDTGTRPPGRPVWLAALAAAAVSAVGLVGLGLAVVVVQTLDPDGGLPLTGSAALGARLWLLAQGGALDLPSGPLVLAPLLLTLALAWGLSRAGRGVVHYRDVAGAPAVAGVVGTIVGVHLLITLGVALLVDDDGAGVGLLRTGVAAAVLAAVTAGWGALREAGLVDDLLDRLPPPVRPVLCGALAGLLTAVACCTAVVAIAVASDAAGYAAITGRLGGSGAGAVGMLALSVLLLPNAAAAVLGLAAGPGFVVGSGTLVSVHGVALGPLPALPLLAALPDTQAVPLVGFVSQAVPVLAGLVAGGALGRRLGDEDGGSVVAALWGVLSGVLLGVGAGLLAWAGGGALGDGALAEVGAPPVATALAVAAQAGIAAAVGAAVARWRARG